jgi:hypothetical protein
MWLLIAGTALSGAAAVYATANAQGGTAETIAAD